MCENSKALINRGMRFLIDNTDNRDTWELVSELVTTVRSLRAEIGALRADVVWCVENPYQILASSGMWDDMPGDAPDADILRAVREARTK